MNKTIAENAVRQIDNLMFKIATYYCSSTYDKDYEKFYKDKQKIIDKLVETLASDDRIENLPRMYEAWTNDIPKGEYFSHKDDLYVMYTHDCSIFNYLDKDREYFCAATNLQAGSVVCFSENLKVMVYPDAKVVL